MASHQTTGAGKGSVYRSVDLQSFAANHDYIFGITASYRPDPSGDDCALRARNRGKCWGEVINYDYLEPDGDMVKVCSGHAEYFDWCGNKPDAREYIPENTTT